jgi:hypothetical protein
VGGGHRHRPLARQPFSGRGGALAAQPPATRLESIEYRDRKQSAIAVGFPAVPITSPDWPRLRLLQEVASGGDPLLYNELRGKRSLAYVVFGQQQAGGQGGAFVGYIGTEAKKEAEARQALVDELRRLAKDISLPKEVAGYLVNTAASTKDDVLRVLAREIREFLQNVNLSEEIAKILTTLSFEIKTEIRFIPNSERITGAEPDVKASVRLKRNDTASEKDAKPSEREKDKAGDKDDEGRDSRSRLRFWRRDSGEGGGDGEGDEDDSLDK